MNLAVITSGFLPMPPTMGGAVENLLMNLISVNEENEDNLNFYIFSVYESKAYELSQKYKKTKFIFIKIPGVVRIMDKIIYFFAKNVFKKKNMHSYRYIIQRLYYLNQCSKNLKNKDYDKILLENHPTQYLALKWRKNYIKYEGRYYYHSHNEFPGTYGCVDLIKKTKKIICISNFIENSIKKCINVFDNDKYYVLKNCIDRKKIVRKASNKELEEIKQKLGVSNEKIILFVGRIVPEKGVKELIEAFKIIKSKDVKLIIVGAVLNELKVKTEYESSVAGLVEGDNNIIFTGYVDYDSIYKYYSLANIAVVPSLWDEPAGMTVIEALACGVPLITTYSGGIPEYANDKCAIIVNRDDDLVSNISKAIDLIINDSNKLEQMETEALKCTEKLTAENYYNSFLQGIEMTEILNKKKI